MKLVIGCDHAGVGFKRELMDGLSVHGYECEDCGVFSEELMDYPDIAEKVAAVVLTQKKPGIIICGTGIGVSISANKIPGIRAALCYNEYMASMSRRHNDANMLALGARVLGGELALSIAAVFLATEFEGGRHQPRLDKIKALERSNKPQ